MHARLSLFGYLTTLAALAALLASPCMVAAQQGTIAGRVMDGGTGAPVVSAIVSIEGTQLGAVTDRGGNFEIRNVAAGPQRVRAAVMGLQASIQEVRVLGGQTVTVDFQLSASALELSEIVVRGTRTLSVLDTDAPLETPRAVLVIPAEVMEQAGVVDLTEALDLSASVARQNNFGGLWNSFAVRGFGGDDQLPSNYLVNGFNAGRGFGGSRDLAGTEAVVVLKGPTAALFGRGEPGGAVNLVTKRPTAEAGGQVRSSYDEFGTVRADADFRSGLLGNRAAFRLVGYHEDGESFRETVEWRSYGLFPSVLLNLGARTSLVYELEASRKEVPFDRGVVAVDGQLGVIPVTRFLGEPGDGPMTGRVMGHQVEMNHRIGSAWRLLLGANFRDTSLRGFSTEPELAANRQRLGSDGRTLSRQRRHRAYDAEYRVYRAELSGQFWTGPLVHRLIVGADRDRFDNDQVFQRYRGPVVGPNTTSEQHLAIDIFNPAYGQYRLPELVRFTDRLEVLSASGVYLQDQVNLTDRLQVRLGLRYDDYSQTMENRLTERSAGQSDSRVSPQLGVVFRAWNDLSLYGSYGEGFRANSGTDFAGEGFAPNQSRSMEAGANFQLLRGGLQGNVALFQLTQQNMLTADAANPGFSLAIGEARSRGFEADLAGRYAGVDLHASYAYTDAVATRDVLDRDFGMAINAGDRLINVPPHSLSALVSRQATLAGRAVTTGSGVLHVGERSGQTATTFTLPAYTVWRAFVGLEPRRNVTLRAELDNVFNTTYYSNSYSTVWVQPGSPRRARVSAQVGF
jgi:iron complex outermembrane recepter protein